MVNSVRLFIACNINSDIRRTITDKQNELKKCHCPITWVHSEHIHLTLKFLGEVKIKKIGIVKDTLDKLLQNTKPIQTELTELGAFPNIMSPQILWVGINDDKGQNEILLAAELRGIQ